MTARIIPPDNDQRRLAAGELEKNFVVLAGAGTGKTTLLIDRLTLLILGKEIPIEKIVALTFTKKAAEEMRERLEKRLRDVINGTTTIELLEEKYSSSKPKWTALAKKALEDIPKSQIGTIHSFAGHLLRLYPLQSGVDPKFREDQGMIGENVFENLWNGWIAKELADKSAHSKEWTILLQQTLLSELKSMAWTLVNPMVDLTALKKKTDLLAFYKSASAQLESLWEKYPDPVKARSFRPGLEALGTIFSLAQEHKRIPSDLLDLIESVDKPPTAWIEAKPILKDLKKFAQAFAYVDDALFAHVFARLLPFVEKVRRELARVGAVSFDGLLVFSRNLLRDHVEVRAALKKRFEAFLIDEFQDTDPLQGEILFYLAERPESNAATWQQVKLEPGRLFVVGDPKQSIYRFRGADIAAFEAFEEHMVDQGAIQATLSANFRSDPRILNFVNAIFPPHMREEKYLQPAYSPLEPGRKIEASNASAVRIVQIHGEESEKLSAKGRRIVEAQTIADWIESQVKAGVSYADVAILLRSANAFEEYLEAFRRRGIPYLAEGEKTFYRTSEVLDFLNLLSVVADPNDKLALVGVLRSPVGGLNDKEILEMDQANALSILKSPRVHKEKVGRLFEDLKELSMEAQFRPLGEVIRKILNQTWALELASTSLHGEQAIANLLKVGRLAEIWSEQTPMILKDFVRRFDQYRDDERDEGENPLADVKYDAVKVLTIHKAKGLEFPIVILPNLSAGKRGGSDKKVLRRDWSSGLVGLRLEAAEVTNSAMVAIESQERQRELAEEVRVFYVAATRAKSQVVCFVSGEEKEAGRFAEILKSAESLPDVLVEKIEQKPLSDIDSSRAVLSLSNAWNVAALAGRINKRSEELAKLEGARLLVSPTSLLSEPEKKPRVEDDEAVLSREQSILIGHICHKVLEEWDFKPASPKQNGLVKKAVERASKLYGLSPFDPSSEAIKKEAEDILVGFLKSDIYLKLAKAKIVGRELPFLYPNELGAMRGLIDLLYELDGKLVVADYKTNKIKEGGQAKVIDHYRPQGDAYQNAVLRSLGKAAQFELIFLREPKSVIL